MFSDDHDAAGVCLERAERGPENGTLFGGRQGQE